MQTDETELKQIHLWNCLVTFDRPKSIEKPSISSNQISEKSACNAQRNPNQVELTFN